MEILFVFLFLQSSAKWTGKQTNLVFFHASEKNPKQTKQKDTHNILHVWLLKTRKRGEQNEFSADSNTSIYKKKKLTSLLEQWCIC